MFWDGFHSRDYGGHEFTSPKQPSINPWHHGLIGSFLWLDRVAFPSTPGRSMDNWILHHSSTLSLCHISLACCSCIGGMGSWAPTAEYNQLFIKKGHGNPISELRDVTCPMEPHSVTCHPTQVNMPRQTPAMQAGTRFTYPGGMEGWVDLVDLIVPQPGVEPATFWSRVRRRTAAPPRQLSTVMSLSVGCVESG